MMSINSLHPTMLVVDDDSGVRETVAELVQRQIPGTRVLTAATSDQAEDLVRRNRVDVVVVEYRLSDMTGVELLERLRRLKPDLLAVLMTTMPDAQVVVEAINRGRVRRILVKPFDGPHAAELLSGLLQRRRGLAGRIPPSPRLP